MARRTVLIGLLLVAIFAFAASASPVLPVDEPVIIPTQPCLTINNANAHPDSAVTPHAKGVAALSLGDFTVDFAVTVSADSIETAAPLSPPALPSAFVLTLLGFILLSLVRDRLAWFGAGMGLFRLTQAGLVALPRAVCSIAPGRACDAAVSGRSIFMEQKASGRAITHEISFIGLLHRLGSAVGDGTITDDLRRKTWTFQNAARLCCARPAAFSFAYATSTARSAGAMRISLEIGKSKALEIFYPRERR